eukprot:g349.t1
METKRSAQVKHDIKRSSVVETTDDDVLDLLVIGSGPHALSLLTRLVDDEPDLLTEMQRGKITEDGAKRARTNKQVSAHLKKRFDAVDSLPRTLVVDANGSWMAQWKANFEALDIRYLRSHFHMHPCPFDFQSLSVWAKDQRREDELKQMKHVDREACRKSGYYGPFVVPSTRLFLDFCASLVDRYNLEPLVRRGFVRDVRIVESESAGTPRTFEVRLADGSMLLARRVVCALGPGPAFQGMLATLPWWADDLARSLEKTTQSERTAVERKEEEKEEESVSERGRFKATDRMQHSATLTTWLRNKSNLRALKGARVLVVGGGQTAAHLVKLALRCGCASATLCARRRITQKPYDVDVEVVGDKRPRVLREFWDLSDPTKRLEFNKALRGGGSMSGDVFASFSRVSSHFTLVEETEVVQAHWVSSPKENITVRFDNGDLSQFDLVWLATGGMLDLELVPIFSSLLKQHPIRCVDGLPVLQDDLAWAENVPLYVMGAFAQLQLGADALNLAGARSGGVLVARALSAEHGDE